MSMLSNDNQCNYGPAYLLDVDITTTGGRQLVSVYLVILMNIDGQYKGPEVRWMSTKRANQSVAQVDTYTTTIL